MLASRLLLLTGNLIPALGVLRWGWDTFELLMLFWMQTAIVVAFTLLRLRKIPEARLGDIRVNGKRRAATHRDLLLAFGSLGFFFLLGHFVFLWVMFSGDGTRIVRGPSSFWLQMVIENGAWAALALSLLSGAAQLAMTPPRGALVRSLFGPGEPEPADIDQVGEAIAPMLVRIFALQAALVIGAMFLQSYGTQPALLILIGLKTLSDLSDGRFAIKPRFRNLVPRSRADDGSDRPAAIRPAQPPDASS